MTDTVQREFLKRALIEHLRGWIGGDALWSEKCREKNHLAPKTLRKIATSYYVSRGFLEGKEGRVAELIEGCLRGWPDTLKKRAQVVQRLAEHAYKTEGKDGEKLTNGRQFSGFSKLLWFLRPDGWAILTSMRSRGWRDPKNLCSFFRFTKNLKS